MKKNILICFLVFVLNAGKAQILGSLDSVNPNTAAQGQTLVTTITQVSGSYLLGSPPCDNHGIFLCNGLDTIFCNYYAWQWMDIVDAEFTIPPAAALGFYDVYVASTHYDWWWGTCTNLGFWMLSSGFEVTASTGFDVHQKEDAAPVVYPNPVAGESKLIFNNAAGRKYELTVLDAYGRNVSREILSGNSFQIASKEFDAGIYYYTLTGLESTYRFTGRFVVIK